MESATNCNSEPLPGLQNRMYVDLILENMNDNDTLGRLEIPEARSECRICRRG